MVLHKYRKKFEDDLNAIIHIVSIFWNNIYIQLDKYFISI